MLGSPSLDEKKEGKRNPGFHAGLFSELVPHCSFFPGTYFVNWVIPLLAGIFIPEAFGFWWVSGLAHGSFFFPKFIEFHFQRCLILLSCFVWLIWQS